jgi:hypothetical protein
MKYIDRLFLFPVAAVSTVWAQQPSPAAAEAEAALRARVEQFYQFQVDKKFRQSESMVAEDSKDDYYNRAKQNIKRFSIEKIELMDDNTRATVTLKENIVLTAALIGSQAFDMPLIATWKVENGQWVWFLDPATKGQTPFGKFKAGPAEPATGNLVPLPVPSIEIEALKTQVTVDRESVTLNAAHPEDAVTFTNHMPGSITLELTKPQMAAVSVDLEKSNLKAGETGTIQFRLSGEAKSSGIVRVVAAPLNQVFEIQVRSN